MAANPRILVVDGYAEEGRAGLREGGATTAGELYTKMLAKCCPSLETDIVYPADPGAGLPGGPLRRSRRQPEFSGLPPWPPSPSSPRPSGR